MFEEEKKNIWKIRGTEGERETEGYFVFREK